MISEHVFIQRYTSFWQAALPMGNAVLRQINRALKKKSTAWRFCREQKEHGGPIRRDLASELGLRLLAAQARDGQIDKERPSAARIEEAKREALAFVQLQRGLDTPALPEPNALEIAEAGEITRRLTAFLARHEPTSPVTVLPTFPGCGILAACQGDLLAGETLYEMKASEEGFRVVDLRQLLVYGALNFASRGYAIRRFGLINPRLGVFFRANAEELVEVMAGRAAIDLFSDILDFLSTERASA